MTSKISVYSLPDLKATVDDHIPMFLTSPNLPPLSTPLDKKLRFSETHFYTLVRLVLGYAAVLVALYIFYLDYYLKVSWADHKVVTAWAVLVYVILNTGMTAWTWTMERGIVFEGSRGPSQLRLYSLPPHRKYDPTYRLVAEYKLSKSGGFEKSEHTAPFTQFFQADGTFVSGELERWLRVKLPESLLGGKSVDDGFGTIDVDTNSSTVSGTDAPKTPGSKKKSKRG